MSVCLIWMHVLLFYPRRINYVSCDWQNPGNDNSANPFRQLLFFACGYDYMCVVMSMIRLSLPIVLVRGGGLWSVVTTYLHRCTVQRDRKIPCCVYNSRLPLLKARSYSISSFFLHSDVDCDRNIPTLWTCLDVIKAIDCGRKRASPCVVMYGECFTRYCDQGSCYELCFTHFGVDIVCKYSKR